MLKGMTQGPCVLGIPVLAVSVYLLDLFIKISKHLERRTGPIHPSRPFMTYCLIS
jgi:hypothetical protein